MNSTSKRTSDRNEMLKIVHSTPNEMEAQLIINALEESGIEADMQGQHSAGFRAENPQEVKVVVRAVDFERATDVVSQTDLKVDVDWDKVDVGEPEDA